jgi:AraC-like DNA-binding protein
MDAADPLHCIQVRQDYYLALGGTVLNRERKQPAPLEWLHFDSDEFPARERFARYVEANRGGAHAYEAGPHFRARLERWRLGRLVLHERWLNDVVHERTSARACEDGVDHLYLTILISGRYELDTGRGFAPIVPGRAAFVDMREAMRSRAHDAHVMTVSIARDLVESAVGEGDGLHGTILDTAAVGLLTDLARSIIRAGPALHATEAPGVTRAIVALLAAGFDRRRAVGDPGDRPSADVARFDRARQLVEQHLGDPQFGPAELIAQLGVSRATLYRLFRPQGGMQAYIQKRRLDRVRVALTSQEEQRPLASIATEAGFLSESHCSRLFLEAFGVRPGEYRGEVTGDSSLSGVGRRVPFWLRDLH